MASFGAKRKARVIQTLDLDEDGPSLLGGEEPKKDGVSPSSPQGPLKFGRNKPSKSSSLRKSFNVDDLEPAKVDGDAKLEDDDSSEPVVIRPSVSRSSSLKKKRQSGSSRLSFGAGEGQGSEIVTPKKSLGHRALENSALKNKLPTRFVADEEEKPRYSKEFLEELQSSTPNTPQNLSSQMFDDGEMDLDPSELEGALIVQSQDLAPPAATAQPTARILSDAEIREKKERRARLAQESDFISLDDSGEENGDGSGRVTIEFKKKKTESRLIAEDEDLGEGYDEFVLDGKLALGKKAEKEAVRRQRQEMADLIQAAEDGSDAESDDSEAERRAAYEAAQRRAGMDGLSRPDDDDDMQGNGANQILRMKPLPELDDVLQRIRNLVKGLEDDVTRKNARIAGLEKEKQEILDRENEVQEILNQAGEKYRSVVAQGGGQPSSIAAQSPLRPFPPGIAGDLPVERGLESFGATPTRRPDIDTEMD